MITRRDLIRGAATSAALVVFAPGGSAEIATPAPDLGSLRQQLAARFALIQDLYLTFETSPVGSSLSEEEAFWLRAQTELFFKSPATLLLLHRREVHLTTELTSPTRRFVGNEDLGGKRAPEIVEDAPKASRRPGLLLSDLLPLLADVPSFELEPEKGPAGERLRVIHQNDQRIYIEVGDAQAIRVVQVDQYQKSDTVGRRTRYSDFVEPVVGLAVPRTIEITDYRSSDRPPMARRLTVETLRVNQGLPEFTSAFREDLHGLLE
ncbi:MAG: hypothetical protein SF066_18140 [Thermoanaerobaculia bacterium]|nr:hypothetical protein [Thermoanaerobaculia bacterium]